MQSVEDIIKELAAVHGRPDVTDREVEQIKQAIAVEIIDAQLDDVPDQE